MSANLLLYSNIRNELWNVGGFSHDHGNMDYILFVLVSIIKVLVIKILGIMLLNGMNIGVL